MMNTAPNTNLLASSSAPREVREASKFISGLLSSKIGPDEQVALAACIAAELAARCADHWHPEAPARGQAVRAVRHARTRPDPAVARGFQAAGCAELAAELPREFTVWVDPGDVSMMVGEHNGVPISIYSTEGTEEPRQQQARVRSPSPTILHLHLRGLSPNARTFVSSSPTGSPTGSPQLYGTAPTPPPAKVLFRQPGPLVMQQQPVRGRSVCSQHHLGHHHYGHHSMMAIPVAIPMLLRA